MTTHHHPPTPQDPMPLDAEERALAARLARLGPHGEPSPALDARVLAAAHAAHAATPGGARADSRSRAGRERGWRRARWPVGVGVAASVALAAGIAWQMRPLPAPVFAPATSVPAASAPASPGPGAYPRATPPEAPRLQAMRNLAGPAQPEGDATAGRTNATPGPAVAHAIAAKAMAPPPPEAPPVVFDEPSPVAVAAPPPAPPAPPAPVAAQTSPVPAQAQSQDALPVFDAEDADAPEADVPPATAASPQVRDAWLARIRELAAGGRTDDARASLAEFRRRYPAFAIPDDLRPLLPPSSPQAQPPTPTPR